MLTEDVMGDYQYAIIDVEVTRRLPLAIYVIDVKSNGYLKQTTDITEKQRFEAVDGLHPRDPERDQILSRFPASSAINQYVATPVSIEAGSVLSAALGVMQGEVAAQPMTTLAQDIERGAIQSPLAAMLASAGHCDAFFDNLVEQLKNGRCAAEADSLKGFVEAVGGPSRSAADTGILSTARTPDLYKSVPANDERWMTVGESAQPNCSAPLAVRSPQDTFMECVRVISCGARAAACGRELTRQNRNMACPRLRSAAWWSTRSRNSWAATAASVSCCSRVGQRSLRSRWPGCTSRSSDSSNCGWRGASPRSGKRP